MTVERGIRTAHVLTGGLSVLVVDDEPSVRRMLGVLLHEYGYRARLAADGVEARSIVEMEEVALILCNVHVRDESGQALVRNLLRQSHRTVALMMLGSDEFKPTRERTKPESTDTSPNRSMRRISRIGMHGLCAAGVWEESPCRAKMRFRGNSGTSS